MEFWENKQAEIAKEQESTLGQITKMKNEEAKYFEIWLNVLDLATRAREIYQKRTSEERRLLLSHIFSNLVLSDKKLNYTLKEPIKVLAERLQQGIVPYKNFELEKSFDDKAEEPFDIKMSIVLPRLDSNQRPIA